MTRCQNCRQDSLARRARLGGLLVCRTCQVFYALVDQLPSPRAAIRVRHAAMRAAADDLYARQAVLAGVPTPPSSDALAFQALVEECSAIGRRP